MPLLNTITTPYAEAFLQVAESRQEVDQVVDQAKAVLALWHESPELRQAMASPVLEVDAKKAALEKLFSDQLTPSFLNLLKLLADRQPDNHVSGVCNGPSAGGRDLSAVSEASVGTAPAPRRRARDPCQ